MFPVRGFLAILREMEQLKDQDTLVPWFTRAVTHLLGVKMVSCAPVLAGSSDKRSVTDAARRDLPLSEPPIETVFYNLRPDRTVLNDHLGSRFDYVIGDSDAENDPVLRIGNFDMIYWSKIGLDHVYDYNQAIILRSADLPAQDADPQSTDKNWLCIRRVGDESRKVFAGNGDILVRSKQSDGSLLTQAVPRSIIVGYVYGKYHIVNKNFVRAATSAPLYKPEGISFDNF